MPMNQTSFHARPSQEVGLLAEGPVGRAKVLLTGVANHQCNTSPPIRMETVAGGGAKNVRGLRGPGQNDWGEGGDRVVEAPEMIPLQALEMVGAERHACRGVERGREGNLPEAVPVPLSQNVLQNVSPVRS